MKLIVGLGNPGRKYQGTRHNVGFQVIAELHQRFGSPQPSAKFNSELVQINVDSGNRLLLQSPLTFMNLSGQAVRGAMDFYKIERADLLVVCDDFHLDLGRLRFRPGGSAGGQNGLKDIIQKLGSPDFARLRVGVGKPPAGWDVANYVLSKFRDEETADLEKSILRAADGVQTWLQHGTQESMNRFNADPKKPKPEKKVRKSVSQSKQSPKKPGFGEDDADSPRSGTSDSQDTTTDR